MGTEPLAFRNPCGRAQMPFDQKLSVPVCECLGVRAGFRMRSRFIQEFQAGQCVTDCAGHVKEISDLRAVPEQGLTGRDYPNQRQAEKPSPARSRRISADQSDVVWAAGGHHTSVQLVNLAAGAGTGNRQGGEQMLRCSSHRCDVAEIRCGGAEADIAHRGSPEIEMDPFC